ncbi:MAG: Zn-ribbon domain-containing OB-fold protein [Anaerolineales bacterium]
MTLLEPGNNSPSAWRDEVPVTNRYTFGVAGERFFRAIKDEQRILGTHCSTCDRIYVPAAVFCERCLNQLDEWVDVGTVGEIVTFTHLYVDYDGSPLEKPKTIAFIRFGDGGLIHRLVAPNLDQVEIGMQAEAVFKPASEREGSILDISHFEIFNN